jgi:hypothetical protein
LEREEGFVIAVKGSTNLMSHQRDIEPPDFIMAMCEVSGVKCQVFGGMLCPDILEAEDFPA